MEDNKTIERCKDRIVRGLLCEGSINMTAVSGRELVEAARQAHGLSHVCTAALGRLLMQTAMMSVQLKTATDNLTVIFDGSGAAGRFVAVGHEGGKVKGYVDSPSVELPLKPNGKLDVSGAVGTEGEMRVIRDLSLKEPYVGRCAITDGEIANDFANYFVISEQQPSLVYLGVRVDPVSGEVRAASGIMLQPLPYCPERDIAYLEMKAQDITNLTRLIDEGEDLEGAIIELIGELHPEFTERATPEFICDCSKEKLEAVLISLGREELSDMIERDGEAELTCRFCNKKYHFTREELEKLLENAESTGGADD